MVVTLLLGESLSREFAQLSRPDGAELEEPERCVKIASWCRARSEFHAGLASEK